PDVWYNGVEVVAVPQLTLELPDTLAQWLARRAAEQKKSPEQVALEELTAVRERFTESLDERYERFFRESGLFVEIPEEEKKRHHPLSESALKKLAAKLGAAGPLSEVIIAERGKR